jgi:Caspase domain/Trypsin-like peptidase domain
MPGKRIALLIANAEYQHDKLRKLITPQDDVQALKVLLTRPDIGGYQAQVLIDADKRSMERAIDRMLSMGEREDTVLIFFAGHGLKHENGKLYFAAIDTEPEFLGGTAVSAGWLTEQMQNSRVGYQIVLLDCCFGGAFARGNVWRGAQMESGKALEVPDLELEGRGQVIITSADAMQFALEGGALDGKPPASHFVRALTEGLATGEADCNPRDGRITVDELASYLVRKMKILGSSQRPTKWTFGAVDGDLLFALNPDPNHSGSDRVVENQTSSLSRCVGFISVLDLDGKIVISSSGFLVSSKGHVVTCRHVVTQADSQPTREIKIRFPGNADPLAYHVRDCTDENDLVLLESKVPSGPTPCITCNPNWKTVAKPGYPAYFWGWSEYFETPQRLSCPISGFSETRNRIGLNVEISPGDSGAPVFDVQDRLIAVIEGQETRRRSQGVAIPVSSVIDLLSRNGL